jgi:ubiquinone/menaquinone biosynthesis C-methylase UbiE
MDLPSGATILEIGCGPGRLWIDNDSYLDNTWSLFISDLSYGMVHEAINQIKDGGNIIGLVVDAETIPFRNDKFDAVIANHMLFHFDYPSQALQEIDRVLRPGGMIYATTVGHYHLLELRKALIKAMGLGIDVMEDESAQVLEKFTLETGTEKVQALFQDTEMRVYEDWLEITDVEPLIDYVESSSIWDLGDSDRVRLREIVSERIAETGSFKVRKHQGMLVARK